MNANVAKKEQLAVLNDECHVWVSDGWHCGTDYWVINRDSVIVGISGGTGRLIHAQTLESESEYEEFNAEVEYSFQEIGFDDSIFYELGLKEGIEEIIPLTLKRLQNDY